MHNYLECIKCKLRVDDFELICPHCGGFYSLLNVIYPNKKIISNIDKMYSDFLPFKLFKKEDFKNCSLKKYNSKIWLKNEGENYSHSIKEKDLVIGIKVGSYLGFKKLICVSGGSGINAVEALNKKYKMSITLYSPKNTSKKIKNQVLLGNDYEGTFKKALNSHDKKIFNLTPGINPYSQEGSKVISWQIIESGINFYAIIVPVGNGSTLWGIYKGFVEAKEAGLVKFIPKLYAAELTNGLVAKSLETGNIEKNKRALRSKAQSIDIKESFCLEKALIAIKKSCGGIIRVKEKEIELAYQKLHSKEYYASYSGSVSLASALQSNKFFSGKKICCLITASV